MINLKSKESILKYHRWFNRQAAVMERRFAKKLRAILKDQYDDAADYLDHGVGVEGINDAVDFYKRDLEKIYIEAYKSTIEIFHKKTMKELKGAIGMIETKATEDQYWYHINRWIRKFTAEKVVAVNRTTKNNIKRIVQRGMEDGIGNRAIAKEIKELEQITTMFRATRIARTEVHSAAVSGIEETMKESNVSGTILKSWSAALDERTRIDHLDADSIYSNDPIPVEERFNVGGEDLQFPGDPSGSAGNIVNCRCVVIYETR